MPRASRISVALAKLSTLFVLTAAVGIGLFLPPIGVGLLMALRFADVSVGQHFRSYWSYLAALVIGLLISIVSPEITLFLPRRAGLVR